MLSHVLVPTYNFDRTTYNLGLFIKSFWQHTTNQ